MFCLNFFFKANNLRVKAKREIWSNARKYKNLRIFFTYIGPNSLLVGVISLKLIDTRKDLAPLCFLTYRNNKGKKEIHSALAYISLRALCVYWRAPLSITHILTEMEPRVWSMLGPAVAPSGLVHSRNHNLALRSGSHKKHSNGAQTHTHSSQVGGSDGKKPLLEDSSV